MWLVYSDIVVIKFIGECVSCIIGVVFEFNCFM